jgi:uncharacterized delta-60 repeat protein
MSLITRTGKGSKITIEEMDNNLDYLVSLGVKDITLEDTTIKFERVDGDFLEVDINNNLPIVTKRILGSSEEENDTILYKGILDYSMTASQYLPLFYKNSTKSGELNIPVEYGKSYFINANAILVSESDDYYNYSGDYYNYNFSSSLISDINYPDRFVTSLTSSIWENSEKTINNIYFTSDDKIIINNVYYLTWLNKDGSIYRQLDYRIESMCLQPDQKLIIYGSKVDYVLDYINTNNFNYYDTGLGWNRLEIDPTGIYYTDLVKQTYIIDNVIYELKFDGVTYSAYYDSNYTDDYYSGRWFFVDDVEPPLLKPFIGIEGQDFIYYDSGLGYGRLEFYYYPLYEADGGVISDNVVYELKFDGVTYSAYYDSTYTDDYYSGRWFFVDDVEPDSLITYSELIIVGVSMNIIYNSIETNIEVEEPSFTNIFTRLNSDGSIDNTFITGTGFNNPVNTIAVQSDGKILVGGQFNSYNGVSSNVIIRLNSDGSQDSSFVIGTGFNGNVNSIVIQSDGKILLGGIFTTYNGVTSTRIIRLNSDGSIDNTFITGTGFNSTVNTISIQSDGKILVGGQFNSYNGVSLNRIIRLNTDGSQDTSFVIGTGFGGIVNSISIQSDGKILVGGQFTSYNGVSLNRIIRLNTDGSQDTSFNIGTGFNNAVNTITIQDDGKILVGGQFTSYNDISSNSIIRLNSDGIYTNSEFISYYSVSNIKLVEYGGNLHLVHYNSAFSTDSMSIKDVFLDLELIVTSTKK